MDILRPPDLLTLPWPDRCRATLQLFELRQFQAHRNGLPHARFTIRDLTWEVRRSRAGSAQQATRIDLLLTDHLDDPEVAACASAQEAFDLLKQREAKQKEAAR